MRITGYRTLTTVQDWGRPVGDANGVIPDGLVRVPIVVVETDAGLTGVGLGPHVEIEAVFAAIEGEDPRCVTALYDRMLRRMFKAGHAGAVFGTIGAFDSALWDIKAQAAGEPLWRLLGGRSGTIKAYASGINPGGAQQTAEAALKCGHRALKLKVGFGAETDLVNLAALRNVVGDGMLAADANQGWSIDQALDIVPRLGEFGLRWLEEPLRADRPRPESFPLEEWKV